VKAADEQDYIDYLHGRGDMLRRTAYALCGDWHRAEDLVQNAAIRLYQFWPRVKRARSIDSYVRQMLVRVWLDETRGGAFRRLLPTASPPDRPAPAEDLDSRHDVRVALARLAPAHRVVLALRYLEDLDVAETAEILRCSTGAVKARTVRALAALREHAPELLADNPMASDRRSKS